MRASTLFAVIVSLLIGLGAAAGAKYAGLFDKQPDVVEQAPEKKAMPKVLVAGMNLYEGVAVQSTNVLVRELRPEEQEFYNANKSKLLPPVVSAAHLRTVKKTANADQILTNDYLSDTALPPPITQDLPTDYRLVNVNVSKYKSAGGVLRVGEFADVYLTSRVSVAGMGDMLKTALIAKGVKVRMKRDNIFPVLRSDPPNQPIQFTLQANTYRAALIDFATNRGVISLQPTASVGMMMMIPMEDADKIAKINTGDYAISDEDLRRVFQVEKPAAAVPPVRTRIISSTGSSTYNVFQETAIPAPSSWFSIGAPGSTGGQLGTNYSSVNAQGQPYDPNDLNDPNNPKCKTCGKKQDNMKQDSMKQ